MIEPIGMNQHYEAPAQYDRIPEYDPRSGEHYWIQIVAYKVDPSTWKGKEIVYLDQENLVLISDTGCYYCERQWNSALNKRRCPGTPNTVPRQTQDNG